MSAGKRGRTLARRAEEVLRENDRGRHTVPSSRLYPHQWAWDSAFAAVGWSHIDPGRALDELEALFAGQWADGRIPHIAFDPSATGYFPGPAYWECETTSSITNPPVWATALRVAAERGAERKRVEALLEPVERSLDFFAAHRDPLGWGGVAVVHPWESGRDNCPAWDAPLAAVDPERAPPFRRVDQDKVADPAERPTDEQYRRYAVLVKDIAADGFGPGPFAVYDPFMTALLARADDDLRALRAELGVDPGASERGQRARECLERMWSDERSRLGFYDAVADTWMWPDVLASYLGASELARAGAEQGVQSALERRFASARGLPTTAPQSPCFEPRRYWRGPVWVSMNWLFSTGFGGRWGRALAGRTVEMVETAGFWEYFDPHTGAGLGADCFTWSAALVLDLLAREAS